MANIFLRQSAEFFHRFFCFGGMVKMIVKFFGDDEVQLIHEVFNPTANVLDASKVRCIEHGIDFDRFSWDGPEEAPDFDLKDPETVVVLEVNLGNLKDTFEFAWVWTKNGQYTGRYFLDDVWPELGWLRLLPGSEDFKPWTLRWRRIKLDSNLGKKPVDVRDPKTSPGLALLYVSAQHPKRVEAMDYKKRFGWYIPGLEYVLPERDPYQDVLLLFFNQHWRKVWLDTLRSDIADNNLAVPVFLE